MSGNIGEYLERGRRYGDLPLPDLSRRLFEAALSGQEFGDLTAEECLRVEPKQLHQWVSLRLWLEQQGRRRIKKWAISQSGRVTLYAEHAMIETIFNFFNTKEDAKQALADVL